MIVLILIPYLFVEIYLSLYVGERIGVLGAVLWTVATMLVGIALLKNAPFAMMNTMTAMHLGRMDLQRFGDATFAYFIGALLLIVPGVFSDLLGVVALLYSTYLHYVAKIPSQRRFDETYHNQGENDVIDAEIIDEHGGDRDRIAR